jgi:23S rRNA (adenine2503-C2)-methyltransferase
MPDAPPPKPDFLGLLPDELARFLRGLGQPGYRARQVFAWLHRGAGFAEMTDLPKPLRERMAALATAGTLAIAERQTAPDGATRFALRTADDHLVESVLIPHRDRLTVCISSQIGCAMGCSFCATGQQGLVRSLAAGEIVAQVVRVQQAAAPGRVRNVVFMGMGEPLANYDQVVQAVRLLNHPWGLNLGARHLAVSTCGLPAQIRRLAQEGLQVALAISLHGATDEVRSQLVPINRTHPIGQVIAAAREYARVTGRKVAFQYVIVPGLNDTAEQAQALARLVRGMPAMVNLIPRNPIRPEERFDPRAAHHFAARLRSLGLEVAVRRSRGAEVLGACGQLRERLAEGGAE